MSRNGTAVHARQSVPRAKAKPPRRRRSPETKAAFATALQLAVGLRELFGPMCEVVVHDFHDLEHSIVHIEGNVTNRAIGGAATDLLLEKVRQGDTLHDLYAYTTSLPGGRVMKSSTIFLRDGEGCAAGALCINLDVTDFIASRNALNAFVSTDANTERATETLSDNIFETVQSAVAETLYDAGRSLHTLTREEKIDLMNRLEGKGLFQVKKAVPIVADMLGLSRATVYNYLREAHDTQPNGAANGRKGKSQKR